MAGSNSFGLKCTNKGGDLYTNLSAFLGCCAIDPSATADGICPIDQVRPMTFDPAAYSIIPPQACVGKDSTIMWYSCSGTNPPFIGCCSVNPCSDKSGTCPDAALRPGRLSDDEKIATAFMAGLTAPTSSSSSITGRGTVSVFTSTTTIIIEDGPTTSSSSASAASRATTSTTATTMASTSKTASAASNAISATSTRTPTSAAADSAATSSSSPGVGEHQGMQGTTIAGMAAGIGAGVLVLGLFVFWLLRRRRAAAAREKGAYTAASLSHQAPPDYYTVKRPQTPPAELPGSIYYELPGDSPRV